MTDGVGHIGLHSADIGQAIVLISNGNQRSRNLKEMIEFLDAERVVLAGPGNWRDADGASQFTAVFLADDLGKEAASQVMADIGELNANLPIVLVSGDGGSEICDPGQHYPWAQYYELSQPIRFDELNSVLEDIWSLRRKARRHEPEGPGANAFLGHSEALREVRGLVGRVAPTDSTVLLLGESGTGKEVIARRIHALSGRTGDFVAINCGAIPDHLLESELFGHERGAFTGAATARVGRFELANGGTLFLDEIGDMPKTLQVKLLRVLQERTIERIGGCNSTPVDFRLIAATHRDLPSRIEVGQFREDLFYRLSVFPIEIPPLRDRPGDIELLLAEFVDRIQQTHGGRMAFSAAAMACLRCYAWPGNVRELANLVERLAVIGADRTIDEADLPLPIRPAAATATTDSADAATATASASASATVLPEGGINLKDYLTEVERRAIQDALSQSSGVVQGAADILGMGRTTLVEKIKRHGIVNQD